MTTQTWVKRILYLKHAHCEQARYTCLDGDCLIYFQNEPLLSILWQDHPPWLASHPRIANRWENILGRHHPGYGRVGSLPVQQVIQSSNTEFTYFSFCSTVKQFTTRTVSTSLTSSTEPIRDATFPKIVICNKFRLRWNDLFSSKALHHLYVQDNSEIKLLHWPNLVQRQSFVDLLVPSVKNYTGTNYTDKDIGDAFYNHYIAGWGNTTQQVSLKLFGK